MRKDGLTTYERVEIEERIDTWFEGKNDNQIDGYDFDDIVEAIIGIVENTITVDLVNVRKFTDVNKFIENKVQNKLKEIESRIREKEIKSVRGKFKKKEKVSLGIEVTNAIFKQKRIGYNDRYTPTKALSNVIFSSVEKNSRDEIVFSIFCNNKNEFKDVKYVKGTFAFNVLDENKKEETPNYIERMVYNYTNNNYNRQYSYEGLLKVLSIDNTEVFIEFIGKSLNGDFLKYMADRKEFILKRLEEEKKKEMLANRKINRRFHF